MRYDMGKEYGLDEDLIPQFRLGAAKYPVVKQLTVTPADLSIDGVTFARGDMVAAFVGSECRGVYTLDANLLDTPVTMTVFGRQEGEAYTLKYYNAATQRVYTLSKTF